MRFHYCAKKGPQDHQTGEIEAVNERTAVDGIIRMGLTPVEVRAVSTVSASSAPRKENRGHIFRQIASVYEKVFQTDIVLFSRYLADFLSAGVSVLRSLQLIRKYFPHGRMSDALQQVEAGIQSGESLSNAMRRIPDVFPEMHVNMIRAGEQSGSLQETVSRMADFLEQDRDSRLKVASSLIYPMIILCVGLITVFVLFTWVLPKIMVIFDEMDQRIPVITQVLIGISAFFAKFWWLIGIVFVLMVMIFVRWHRTEEGRDKWDRWVFLMPWVGRFVRETSVARFCRTLGTLLSGGVEMVPALVYAGDVAGNRYVRMKVGAVADYVAGGMPLSRAVRQVDIFSETDVSMLSVGEEAGSLSLGLFKLAAFYEKNNERMIKVITTMVEPALILVLGLVVGFIVLAMLMPIFQMNLTIR